MIMISLPMSNNPHWPEKYKKVAQQLTDEGYDVAPLEEIIATDAATNFSLYALALSLEIMSNCDIVYFCRGWENARGCRMEHQAAKEYGLQIIYEV